MYYAHSGTPQSKADWQPLAVHAHNVAGLAASNAACLGLEKAATALGLAHDLGKYDPAFQRRLEGEKLRVDHSTAGAHALMNLAQGPDRGMAELLAYAVLGHHAGLPDRNTTEPGCFERRLDSYRDRLNPVWRDEIALDLRDLLPQSLLGAISKGRQQSAFDLSIIARFLFSCLVDADFKDTERFYALLEDREVDRQWPSLGGLLPEFRARFDAHIAGMPGDGELNGLRRDILAHVRGKAAMPPGLFTLTVPTGGGKTLASLGFALDHAATHCNLRRIVYAIPFTSIVDQTADIFRAVLGGDHILEHHSAIDEDEEAAERRNQREFRTSRDRLKLAMEDWAPPLIVTTNVQLFESLFAARTSRARKLHNLAKSIIILDEAQTIPRHLLKPCVRLLDCMARLLGCTVVLCTATQPALGRERPEGGAGFPGGLDLKPQRELAPDPAGLARRLRRTRIERGGAMDNAALVAALRDEPQGLVIVNSRRHALELCEAAKTAGLDGLVHLTTRQCAAHRRQILADIRERLKPGAGSVCRVIATSLVEAGVDLDFPKVWRAEAGLDSIVQAAGRCNREGRRGPDGSVVTIFSAPDYRPPPEIIQLAEDTRRALQRHGQDVQSLGAMAEFFDEVYWRVGDGLDREKILGDLNFVRNGTDFAFREIARKFRMIESAMLPVIIPYDEIARDAIQDLRIERIGSGSIARRLQRYTVQVPPQAREVLLKNGQVQFESPEKRGDQFAVLLEYNIGESKDRLYTFERGLLWDNPEYMAVEDMIL